MYLIAETFYKSTSKLLVYETFYFSHNNGQRGRRKTLDLRSVGRRQDYWRTFNSPMSLYASLSISPMTLYASRPTRTTYMYSFPKHWQPRGNCWFKGLLPLLVEINNLSSLYCHDFCSFRGANNIGAEFFVLLSLLDFCFSLELILKNLSSLYCHLMISVLLVELII